MEKETSRLDGLDALRGMAALSILVFHCIRLRSLLPENQIPLLVKMLYTGVPLFFCISAFSMCVGYYGKLDTGGRIASFYKRRYLRIAPLFCVMVLAWVLIYSYLWQSWKIPPAPDILLNLTFLFNLSPAHNGSLVAGGWSMSPEFLFYLAFPVLVFAIRGVWPAVLGFALSIVVAAFAGSWLAPLASGYSWYSVVMQMPYFLAGIALFMVFKRVKGTSRSGSLAVAMVGFVAIALAVVCITGLVGVNIWGPHLFALCLTPLILGFALRPFLVNPVTMFLGKVSYGIYLIHPAVVTIIAKPLQEAAKDTLTQWPMLAMVIGVTFIVTASLATLSYYLLERPFMNLGRARSGRHVKARAAVAN